MKISTNRFFWEGYSPPKKIAGRNAPRSHFSVITPWSVLEQHLKFAGTVSKRLRMNPHPIQ